MGLKACIEPDCWQPTAGTRCPEHERAWQKARNARRGPARTRQAAYRKISLIGQACWCCGTTADLTRHHVDPLANGGTMSAIMPMCRPCNSSIGTKLMGGLQCPMHGGQVAPPR